jgi:hypothetical protein
VAETVSCPRPFERMDSGVERQKCFKALAAEPAAPGFFVRVTRVERVPFRSVDLVSRGLRTVNSKHRFGATELLAWWAP